LPPVYLASPRAEELAQGDVVEIYEFFRPKAGTYKDTVHAPAVVLSHSCDFTKYRMDEEQGRAGLDLFPLIVAPVLGASMIPDRGTVGHAVRDRVARYFHLPPEEPLESEDHLIDFWFMQPAAVEELLSIRRVASMTDEWQQRLHVGLDRFFSWTDRRQQLDDATS
jgi:hypothetical protein